MATSSGLGFELEDVVKKAEAADKILEKMVDRSAELSRNMQQAFNSSGSGNINQYIKGLQDMQELISDINGKKLSIDLDYNKIGKSADAISGIIDAVNSLTQREKPIKLFDTNGIYESNNGIASMSENLDAIKNRIEGLKKEWGDMLSGKFSAEMQKSLTKDTGEMYGSNTKTYKSIVEQRKQEIEYELRIEIEKKAIAQRELRYEQMTQDEKAAYIKKKLDDILKEEKRNIDAIRKKYKNLWTTLSRQDREITQVEKASMGKYTSSKEQNKYDQMIILRQQTWDKIVDMENKYQDQLSDISLEKTRQRESKALAEMMRNRKYSVKQALIMASNAMTGAEMESAKGAVKNALMNVDKDDLSTIEQLNAAYINLRSSIEKLTKSQQTENTLQPSIRNAYRKLLKDIEDLQSSILRLKETSAFKSGDSVAEEALSSLEKREKDLLDEKLKYEKQAGGLLDEVVREDAARQAQIRLKEFEKADKEYKENKEKYGTISSIQAYTSIGETRGAANVRQSQQAIEKLIETRDKLDRNDADYENTLESLNAEIARHKKEIEKVTNASRYQAEQQKKLNAELEAQRKTYGGALEYARQAKSVNELRKSIEYLQEARRKEDLSTNKGKTNYKILSQTIKNLQNDYDRLTDSVKNSTSGIMNIGQQIKRATAIMFSVSAIRGYVSQLIQVRGEMELQQKALAAIIQDKTEADKLWSQTVTLAVKSPFTVQQLVTYTKQLAAYRIETEKLHDTTKMLADISSGLGVDMNRLILAYGQVKAANYLRGTELRQFSEAGVNVLKELSDYFTEVEGRAVSVGAVFERVSKRMVSFEDVDKVLRSTTERGGVFYQMQEKQAETLKGQVMNLKDSILLMFNEIGEENDSLLKDAVSLVRSLVNNWRTVASVIKPILIYIATYKSLVLGATLLTKVIPTLWATATGRLAMFRAGIAAANTQQKAFNVTCMKNPYLALASVILSAIVSITTAISDANEEQGELNKTIQEATDEARSLSADFEFLANKAVDAADGSKEQVEALDELKRAYSDIIPSHRLEIDSLREMKGNYDAVTDAIYAQIEAKAKEKVVSDVMSSDTYSNMVEEQKKVVEKLVELGVGRNTARKHVADLVYQLQQGNIKSELGAAQYLERTINLYTNSTVKLDKAITDFYYRIKDYEAEYYGGSIYDSTKDKINNKIESMKEQGYIDIRYETKEVSAYEELKDLYKYTQEYNKLLEEAQNITIQPLDIELEFKYKEQYQKLENSLDVALKEIDEFKNKNEEKFKTDIELSFAVNEKNREILYNQLAKTVATLTEDGLNELKPTFEEFKEKFNSLKIHLPGLEQGTEAYDKEIKKIYKIWEKYGNFIFTEVNGSTIPFEKSIENISNKLQNLSFPQDIEQVNKMVIDLSKSMNGINLDKFRDAIMKSGETLEDYKKRIKEAKDEWVKILGDFQSGSLIASFWQKTKGYTEEEAKQAVSFFNALEQMLNITRNTTSPKDVAKERLKEQISLIKKMASEYKSLIDRTKSASEAQEIIRKKYKDAADEAKMSSIFAKMSFDDKGTAAALTGLRNNTIPRLQGEIDKHIADYSVEIGINAEVKNIDEFKTKTEELFDRLQLTRELDAMGIGFDISGIFGFKRITLNELKKEGENLMRSLMGEELGGSEIAAYNAFQKKITDMEVKISRDRMNNYIKYLTESMSERVQIEIKAMRDINKIRQDETLDQFSKEQAVLQRQNKMKEDLLKFDFDQLKGTEVYLQTFQDLENASKEQLQYVINKLKELRDVNKELTPEQIKIVTQDLEKAEEALGEKDSMGDFGKNLSESIKFMKERNNLLKEQVALQERQNQLEKNKYDTQKKLADLKLKRGSIEDKTSEEWKDANDDVKEEENRLNIINDLIINNAAAQGEVNEKIQEGNEAWDGFKGGIKNFRDGIKVTMDATQSIFDGLSSMGILSDSDIENFESYKNIIGGIDKTAEGLASIELTRPFSVITGIATAVGGLFQTVGGFFGLGDNSKERQIQREIKLVENLQKAYEKLEKKIEEAYSMDTYEESYELAKRNLNQQIAATQRMIQAEEDKKETDNEKIKEWNEQIEQYREQLEELEDQRYRDLGGIGSKSDFKSAAEEFIDAWLEAYKETGDGLSGLEDQFDEFMNNLIKKQLVYQLAESMLNPIFEEINKAVSDKGPGKGKVLKEEIDNITKIAKEKFPELSESLKYLLESLGGIDIIDGNKGSLSELQKGIQGMSEETAQIIGAYLNSIRMYVSTGNEYARDQLTYTKKIFALFDNMTAAHPTGGRGIRVVI